MDFGQLIPDILPRQLHPTPGTIPAHGSCHVTAIYHLTLAYMS